MRILLLILLLLHGLIHLIGFVHEFQLANVRQLRGKLSVPVGSIGLKVLGVLWLATTVLFLLGAVQVLRSQENWSILVLIAIALSQLLILLYWKDAKAGMAANILLLLLALPALKEVRFKSENESLKQAMLDQAEIFQPDSNRIGQLPAPVQAWLLSHTGGHLSGKRYVSLKQTGSMRSKTDGKWVPFQAEQTVTCNPAAFQWSVRMDMAPGLFVLGRDRFENGKGRMLIRMLGLFSIADAQGPETDQGTLVRYLAEMIWYPWFALSPDILWETIDEHRAMATLRIRGTEGSGVFTFNDQHRPVAFNAQRYYDRKGTSTLEHWHVEMDPTSYREFDGVSVPTKSVVRWDLEGGKFEWLQLEVTSMTIRENRQP